MPSDSSPGGTYPKGYDKLGNVPTYLLTSAVAPGYGVADSNGYIGVTQDYNKHANAVDRPTPGSVAASGDELENPDLAFQAGDHEPAKAVYEDDYAAGEGERDSDAKAVREGVNEELETGSLDRQASATKTRRKADGASDKDAEKSVSRGHTSLKDQKAASEKSED
jgi:hypothetical protein